MNYVYSVLEAGECVLLTLTCIHQADKGLQEAK